MRAIADDGYSAVERLEHSPLADDQMLAVALRLSGRQPMRERVPVALDRHFRIPAPAIAQEAQRRAIWHDVDANGLPIERASRAVTGLERRLVARESDLDRSLCVPSAHSSLHWGAYR